LAPQKRSIGGQLAGDGYPGAGQVGNLQRRKGCPGPVDASIPCGASTRYGVLWGIDRDALQLGMPHLAWMWSSYVRGSKARPQRA
jgi:hypothetical protein